MLHEFAELAPEHVMVKAMRSLYVNKADQFVKDTEGLKGPERLDGLTLALRIWPELDSALSVYDKAFAAEPTLDVAVSDVAVPLGPWVRSPADARVTRLLYRPILVSSDDDAKKGKRPGQLAASLESSDLGRRLLIADQSGIFLVRRFAPGIGDRCGTRPGRPNRPSFPAIRSALGRAS